MEYKEFEENKLKCKDCEIGKAYNCVVPSDGNKVNPVVLICGESPGSSEILEKKTFVGKAGKLLRATLNKYGFRKNNSLITNTIPCRPQDNKFPQDAQMVNACVDKWLKQEMAILKPKYLLLIGATPTKYLLRLTGITSLRGKWFECESIPCVPTYHPSFVLRKQYMDEGDEIRECFNADIRMVAEKAGFI